MNREQPRPGVALVAALTGAIALLCVVLIASWPSPADAAQPADSGVRPVVLEPTPEPLPASLLKGFAR